MNKIQEELCKLFQGNLKKYIEKYITNNKLQEIRIKINVKLKKKMMKKTKKMKISYFAKKKQQIIVFNVKCGFVSNA